MSNPFKKIKLVTDGFYIEEDQKEFLGTLPNKSRFVRSLLNKNKYYKKFKKEKDETNL